MLLKRDRMIRLSLGLVLWCGLTQPSPATEPQTVEWKQLRGAESFSDPFKQLSPQQLKELSHLVRLRRLISENKIPAQGADADEAQQIEQRLRDAKIDIEWLLGQRIAVRRMRESQGTEIDPALENQLIEIAGFVIPLKRDRNTVHEFLLVPAFDYCCRVIPPAPNQTIRVRCQQGVEITGRFAAARVSGTLCAETSRWTIQRDDRAVEFLAAYRLDPEQVTVHQAEGASGLESARVRPRTVETR